MAKTRVEVGYGLYLFKEPGGFAPECVISCHGYYRAGDSPTAYNPPANVTLNFYCHHNHTLTDVPQVRNAELGNPKQTVIRGTKITNYILSKYQAHGAEITKAENLAVKRGLDNPHQMAIELVGMAGEAYEHLEAMNLPGYDIVTIRNKWWMHKEKVPEDTEPEEMPSGEVRLRYVIRKVQAKHRYNDYPYLFCRELKA
jgi:hypothetical protein